VVCAAGTVTFGQDLISNDEVAQESLKFSSVYALVEQSYADPISPDGLILEGGIRKMLSTLDPFSAFFNENQFDLLKQQTRGRALGFGSVLYVTPGKVIVLEAAQNSPSGRAGLGPGDEIVEINGQRIDRLDFRSLVELLQRSRSQSVGLSILHPGKLLTDFVKLDPAQVAMPTVDIAFNLGQGIGYVHLTGFEQKTPQEVMDAVKQLGGDSLKGLLLDLRDNHGGIIDAAVWTASLFLPPEVSVLTVRGRSSRNQSYKTISMPARFEMPLIVLVNGNTASAAEIVAAALEEHDRGLIAGETTFGKGVVEKVGSLGEKMGLALTIAQYYTPSGRSIQRPMPGTALADPQSAASGESAGKFQTDNGRPVVAGGGITPDETIAAVGLDPWVSFLDQRGIFSNFASDYLTRHTRPRDSFEPDDQTLGEFHDFLLRIGIRAPDEFWGKDSAYLKLRIQTEVTNLVFGLTAGNEVETRGDPQVQKTVALFPKLSELLKPPIMKSVAASKPSSSGQTIGSKPLN
jgi:carboxyl-terminal processing protease